LEQSSSLNENIQELTGIFIIKNQTGVMEKNPVSKRSMSGILRSCLDPKTVECRFVHCTLQKGDPRQKNKELSYKIGI